MQIFSYFKKNVRKLNLPIAYNIITAIKDLPASYFVNAIFNYIINYIQLRVPHSKPFKDTLKEFS